MIQFKNDDENDKKLSKYSASLCHWFVNNKLNFYFGKDEIVCCFLLSEKQNKKAVTFNILDNINKNKRYSKCVWRLNGT